ncbi:TRAP transporter large permease [Paenibacillus sp. J5C_2022]|uniref:TRAP transporter large permease n=1 Tax=Paenibacillus sp. J5C2022 TaxID=2977129 RepID=UPI0021D2788D|nr:TRAP transporter large permease [Paenibacillus sp. J5C2022]MCU6710582.1 TRAP transporter large permease [Paenibacillus sp. J5C2022]
MELMFIVFFALLLIGVPIYAAIGTATILPLIVYGEFSPTMLPQTFFSGIDNFVLMAVALFIISGAIMQASGLTDDILEVADSLVGNIPGGVGISTILASTLFAALTGSGLAATVAIGSITIGGMIQRGYKPPLAGALSATGGALGVLIPPSNPLIIYGVLSSTSIGTLFMAGMIPGLLIASSFAVVMYFIGKRYNLRTTDNNFSWARVGRALWKGKWGLLAPVIILGSIYSGIATPTEAAELAVFYALFYGLVIRRNVKASQLVEAFRVGAVTAAVMLAMTGVASGFGRLTTLYQVPQSLGNWIASITDSPELVLLMLLGVLIITGMFMETLSQIIILTPIFVPILAELGINPVFFGVLLVLGIEMGFLTPPVGGNLFVATKMSNSTILQVSKYEVPFILVILFWAIFLIFFPEIVLFLPNLIGGAG